MLDLSDQQKFASEKISRILDNNSKSYVSGNFIVHYTSTPALLSIIQNREVWFSSFDMMNDISEVSFFATSLLNVAKDKFQPLNNGRKKELFKAVFDEFKSSFFDRKAEAFVFCGSLCVQEERDGSLSMWRGYGADGDGCAIMLDSEKALYSGEYQFPLSVFNVNYCDLESAKKLAENIVDEIIAAIFDYSEEEIENNWQGICIMYSHRLADLCFITKHSGFKEEKEFRIIYRKSYDLLGDESPFELKPVAIENKIMPKLVVPLVKSDAYSGFNYEISNILARIIIGPSNHQEATYKALSLALKTVGVEKPQDILIPSQIPYRRTR